MFGDPLIVNPKFLPQPVNYLYYLRLLAHLKRIIIKVHKSRLTATVHFLSSHKAASVAIVSISARAVGVPDRFIDSLTRKGDL